MTASLDFLAGIGSRKINSGTINITMQDIVTDRYRGMMKAQMQACTDAFMQLIADIKGVSADILYDALLPTLELAKEYCPKKTGALVNSAYMDKQTFEGGARVVLGFAKGGEPNYAVMVHEMTNLHHQSPTRSKFLLAAIEEDQGNAYGRIMRGFKLP